MKITLEKIGGEKAKVTLEFDNKTYSEVWQREPEGGYSTNLPITEQLKADEEVDDLDHSEMIDFLEDICMADFVDLCDVY